MSNGTTVNKIQAFILHRLFTNDSLRFSEINIENIPSDQFSYHLRQLIKYDLVEKTADNIYRLTVRGRGRAILLDANSSTFIEQGYIACRIILSHEYQGKQQYLMQRRRKVPYLGYISEPGGKVLFGEDIAAAARRNMLVETGLDCQMVVCGVAHFKDNYQQQVVQDKFFFVIEASQPEGELLPHGPTGSNVWMTLEEITAEPKVHQGVTDMIGMVQTGSPAFIEATHIVEEY